MTQLRFNSKELEIMEIEDTMTSAKVDGMIYCAFKDQQDIREIHLRLVESRNKILQMREYIPPQLYKQVHGSEKDLLRHEKSGHKTKDTNQIRRTRL